MPARAENTVFGVRVIGQALVERGPDAAVAPVGVASVDGVPFAVFRRQHSPGRAGAGNPKYGGDEASAIGFTADVEVGAAAEEGEDFVPLVGCQFQVCHAAMITPKCQHGLGMWRHTWRFARYAPWPCGPKWLCQAMPNRRTPHHDHDCAYHRHDSSDRAWAILEPILPGGPGKAGRPHRTTAASSMAYSGFCALAHLGATCPRTTDTGSLPTIASATGRKMALGSGSWTPWPTTPIWSG